MIENLIITLREGIEIALVIGVLIVYLRKTGRTDTIGYVYGGLIAAVAVSIGGAVVLNRFAIDEEALEGYFLLIASVFVLGMMGWMWGNARKMGQEIREKLSVILEGSSSRKARWSIGIFTFFMIVREGIETVIFLQAVSLSSSGWQSFAGTVAGILLAVAFAVLFIRGSLTVDVSRFLKITALTLSLFAVQLLINALHEFYENGVFPASPRMMGILGPIVRHDVFFLGAVIAIPAFMLLIPGRQTERTGRQRRLQIGAAVLSLGLIFVVGVTEVFSSRQEMDLSAQEIAVPKDSVITIPYTSLGMGELRRYSVHDRGLEIRFFVIRTGVNSYATAFDACHACYSYGRYYRRNEDLICSQCQAPFPIARLKPSLAEEPVDENNSGSMEGNGCAPIYLPSAAYDGLVHIRFADIRRQRKYFEITN
ncbi:MAG TPA: Fe-S-containing protein [Bacteroidota bacterium]|nr:Fe-S-containing protein [Bacteroidota bacterium]